MYCSSSDYDESSSFQSLSPKRNLDSPSNVSNFTVSARNCRDNFPNHNNDYDEEPRRKRPENEKPNHILLFTIINPSYPITTDVLKQICQGSGNVVRIVVFKKNGVQAMIEFETLEDAKNAKETLNGADIYSGCCTLKIEYAKPTKLNVYKNDSESWDYTQPALGRTKDGPPSRPGPLLPEPPRHMGPNNSGPPSMPPNYRGGYPDDDYFGAPAPFEFERSYNNPVLDKFIGKRGMQGGGPPSSPHGFRRPPLVANNPPMTPTGSGAPGGSCVLMVYELDAARVNPDKVFNLFCLYGNVAKIKFLKTKEGCCMVQMGDALSADRVIANLSKTMLSNGKRLAVAYSKQVYLSEVSHPYDLPDGSESFKDFTGSRKNRYMNPKMAMKNRIQAPSHILHFFNAPPDITVEQLAEVFNKADITPAKAINIFPHRNTEEDNNGKPASSSSGLIEFDELKDAVDAIMHCNHVPIQSESGKYPFMLKLCFSSSRSVNSSSRRHRDYEEEVD